MHNKIEEKKMSEALVLEAQKRDVLGTGSARASRKDGFITAEVYGNGKPNLSLILSESQITRLYRNRYFTSTVFAISVEGGEVYEVVPKSVQLHPVKDYVRHVDFMHLATDKQKVDVAIAFVKADISIGIKRGGFLNISKRKISLLCDVNSIPASIEVDLEKMKVGDSVHAHDLVLPEGVSLIDKTNFFVASITGKASKDDAETPQPAAATKGKK